MALSLLPSCYPSWLTASANVRTGPGGLLGVFVAAASGTPTLAFYDTAGTSTSQTIVDVFTPVAGTWYPLPFKFQNGLYVLIGGTVSATVAWQ